MGYSGFTRHMEWLRGELACIYGDAYRLMDVLGDIGNRSYYRYNEGDELRLETYHYLVEPTDDVIATIDDISRRGRNAAYDDVDDMLRRCDAIMDAAVKMRGKVGDAADSDRRDGGWREAGDLIDRICERLDYQLPRVGPDIRNSMDW